MGKFVRKSGISPYNIGPFESWLSDMAKEGLVFCKFGSFGYRFEKTEPQDNEYRVEISKKPLSKETMQVYRDRGWTFVAGIQDALVFCAPASADYTEIHTDPIEQGYTIKGLTRKNQILGAIIILVTLFYMSMIGYFLIIDPTPVYSFFSFGDPILLSCGIYLIFPFMIIRQMIALTRQKSQLFSGKPISHHADWKKPRRTNFIFNFLLFVVVFVSILNAVLAWSNYFNGDHQLTMDSDLPVPYLTDIEGRQNMIFFGDVKYNNYYTEERGFLVFREYRVYEQAWEDSIDEGAYSAMISSEYYELSIPFLVNGFMDDLMEHNKHYDLELYPEIVPKEIEYDGLDRVLFLPDKYTTGFSIVASKGNRVIYVNYWGEQDYMKVIDAIADSL